MTSRDFCFWMQGFFEISQIPKGKGLTCEQVKMVQEHLALVFKHDIGRAPEQPNGTKKRKPSKGSKETEKLLEQLRRKHGGWEREPLFC